MINLDLELKKRFMKTKIIMQIHDELIFDSPLSEIDEAMNLIKMVMESAIVLNVSTSVKVNYNDNWCKLTNTI